MSVSFTMFGAEATALQHFRSREGLGTDDLWVRARNDDGFVLMDWFDPRSGVPADEDGYNAVYNLTLDMDEGT